MITPIGDPLNKSAQLWRYVRLSTLLLLMTKKHVFVPTIETLRKGDPLELTIVCNKTAGYFKELDAASTKWLKSRRKRRSREPLFTVWAREILWRRCAWCWHEGNLESIALWHIYAREGVAICSTVQRLTDCLLANKRVKGAGIGRINYCSRSEPFAGSEATKLPPYVIKDACYAFEKEVRVIFPTSKQHLGGLTLELDPIGFIESIEISPYLPESEAVALRQLIQAFWPTIPCEASVARASDGMGVFLRKAVHKEELEERERRFLENLRHRAGVAKFGIVSRLPAVMKRV
jgi:hypothetical protein